MLGFESERITIKGEFSKQVCDAIVRMKTNSPNEQDLVIIERRKKISEKYLKCNKQTN